MEHLTIPQLFAVWALPILFAITVHEAAHGWVAAKCGDNTALSLGRVTLNPIKHIDLIGTIILPTLMLFLSGIVIGWAKPVPINWNNLNNPRRDMAFVALAGPAANFLMALIWASLAKLGIFLTQSGYNWAEAIYYMGSAGIDINIILLILNLIPIPPLDGSRVIYSFLPTHITDQLKLIEPYGLIILLMLLVLGGLSILVLMPAVIVKSFIINIFNLPMGR
jgi:Zn-dependent protease